MKDKSESQPLTEEQILTMKEQELLCAACEHPCEAEIPKYPANFADKITTDEPLLGSTSTHRWQILLCSGVSGKKWPAHLEKVEDSYHAHVNSVLGELKCMCITRS